MFRCTLDGNIEMRPAAERWAERFYPVIDANRAHLLPWMPWAKDATLASTREYYRSSMQRLAADNGFDALIFVEGRPAGSIGFHYVNWHDAVTSIGYWLAAPYVGRGIMTRCCRKMVAHALGYWRLNRVEIRCAVENHRSRAIPRRLGFTEEGILRRAMRLSTGHVDVALYGLLAGEWSASGAK